MLVFHSELKKVLILQRRQREREVAFLMESSFCCLRFGAGIIHFIIIRLH